MQNFFDVVQDRSGNAISNAVVTVFDSFGNLATLFSDNGVTPLANPTSTNADGEYSFFAANGTYSLTITAAGYDGQTRTGIVLFDPNGYLTVNVKTFGALGNGVNDDTTAIQDAIDYCETLIHVKDGLTLGVALQIPAGTYVVSELSVTEPIAIYGDGSAATRLYQKNNTDADLLVVTNVNHFELHGICIDGNKANQTANTGNGAFFDECSNVVMSDCEFRYCGDNGFRSFGGAYLTFDQCSFNNNGSNGTYHTTTAVAVDDGTHYIRGSNSVAYDNGYDGFCYDPGSKSCTLVSCVSHDNGGTGFNVFGNTDGIQPRQVVLSACIAENNDLEGFSCHGSYDVTIAGCQSITNGALNTGTRINGIIVSNDMAGQAKEYDIIIADTTIVGPKGHGIYIDSVTSDAVTNVLISGVLIRNPSQNAANTWDGIYIDKADRVYVSDTYIKDDTAKMRYGITVTSDATQVHVIGGSVKTGVSGQFSVPSNASFSAFTDANDEFESFNTTVDKGISLKGSPRPRFKITSTDNTGAVSGAVGRMYSRESSFYASGLWNNLQWNAAWNLDDTSKPGWDVSTDSDTNVYQVRYASAGSNPRTMTTLFRVDGAAPASAKTAAWLYVNDGAVTSIRQVEVGAVDSGGTGYRLLRVVN